MIEKCVEPNGFNKKCETKPDESNGIFTTFCHDGASHP
jgi:hypothetical protein